MRLTMLAVSAGVVLLPLGAAYAGQRPAQNVSPRRHPNLAAAQQLTAQASQRISDAQRANEWDMGGHAQHAKELLDEANRELKIAAGDANAR